MVGTQTIWVNCYSITLHAGLKVGTRLKEVKFISCMPYAAASSSSSKCKLQKTLCDENTLCHLLCHNLCYFSFTFLASQGQVVGPERKS